MTRKIVVMRVGLLMASLVISAAYASAAITYVDATAGAGGNTAIAPSSGGGVWNPVAVDAVDGMWRARTGFGLSPTDTALPVAPVPVGGSGTVYESGGNSGADNSQRLVTTVSGLMSGTYDVYAYWWSDQSSSPWRIGAALTDVAGNLPLFVGGGSVSGTPLPTQVGTDANGRLLWQASLGQATGTSISVFVDDDPAMVDGNGRSWYDGIGYMKAVPEPASIALLGLGFSMLLVGFRKDR